MWRQENKLTLACSQSIDMTEKLRFKMNSFFLVWINLCKLHTLSKDDSLARVVALDVVLLGILNQHSSCEKTTGTINVSGTNPARFGQIAEQESRGVSLSWIIESGKQLFWLLLLTISGKVLKLFVKVISVRIGWLHNITQKISSSHVCLGACYLHHLVKTEQISTTDVLMVAIHLPAMTSLLWTSRSGIRCSSGDGTSQEFLDIFLGWIAEL